MLTTMATRRFLVVEDEPLVAERVFIPLVSPFGEVVLARDGTAAIAIIDAEPVEFTAVITDICVPGRSGLDVLAHAKARWSEILVLLVTGQDPHNVANAAFDFRADFIEKPVEGARVRRFLMDAISRADRIAFPRRLVAVVEVRRGKHALSEAETDILKRGASAESREKIAKARGVSSETINKQIASLLRKTRNTSFRALIDDILQEAARIPPNTQR